MKSTRVERKKRTSRCTYRAAAGGKKIVFGVATKGKKTVLCPAKIV